MEHVQSIKKRYISNTLYTIGGFLFTVGIIVLFALKTGLYTGFFSLASIGVITFVTACLIYKKDRFSFLSQVLFAISAAVAPVYSMLAIYAFNIDWFDFPVLIALTCLKFAVIFGITLYYTKKYVLHVIMNMYLVFMYFAFVLESIKGTGLNLDGIKDVFALSGMILGIVYFIYTTTLQKKSGVEHMYSFYGMTSFILVLASALFLGGVWNIFYALLLVGLFFLSIHMKIVHALVATAFFSILYILKLVIWFYPFTFSWSLVFILAGLLLLLFGYLTFYLKQKYIYRI
jgi:uncharacterized protein YjeT (DUF2065 family)